MLKKCYKCGLEKDTSDFSKNKSKKDGLACSCKSCRKEYDKEYRADNKDKILEYQRDYVKKYPEKFKNLPIRKFCSFVCKPLILARDNHQCVNCGSKDKLVVHHMLPVKHAQEHILNPKNMVTLCPKCHLEAHSGCYNLWNGTLNKKLLAIIKQKELDNPTTLPTLRHPEI